LAVPRVAAAADRLFGGDGDKVGRSPPQIIGDSILRISNGSFFFSLEHRRGCTVSVLTGMESCIQ